MSNTSTTDKEQAVVASNEQYVVMRHKRDSEQSLERPQSPEKEFELPPSPFIYVGCGTPNDESNDGSESLADTSNTATIRRSQRIHRKRTTEAPAKTQPAKRCLTNKPKDTNRATKKGSASNAETTTDEDTNNRSPPSPCASNATSASRRGSHNTDIAAPLISESEEDDSDNEEDASFVNLPRCTRLYLQDLEDEASVDAVLDLRWPPSPPVAHSSSPARDSTPPTPPIIIIRTEDLPEEESFPLIEPIVGDVVLEGPDPKFYFDWREFPQPQIPPALRRETFADITCGPTSEYREPYDAFTAIWNPEILDVIVKETNRYAQQLTAAMASDGSLCPNSRIKRWKNTDADELLVYFAVIQAMGVVVKSRVEEYWNKTKSIFRTPGFAVAMSIDRFLLLGKCLHFSNNEKCDPTTMTRAQLFFFKLGPLVDHLNNKFSQLYHMSQNIALDASSLMKTSDKVIKPYEICEKTTGYLWRFEIDSGHREPTEKGPISGVVPTLVLRLLEGLEHKGYTVFMDNFYNSQALARELKTRGFDCVGTLRRNRQFVPPELGQLTKQNMRPGQVCGCTSGDVDIVLWYNKNIVAALSTYHGLDTVNCNGTLKPSVISDYSNCMRGVDRKDRMLANYPITHRHSNKFWYKKLFRRMLNTSILNAYIMFNKSSGTLSSISHRQFRITLITELLDRHKKIKLTSSSPVPSGNHFPAPYARSGRERLRRNCKVCSKRTRVYCMGCLVPLCVFTCFEPHHRP